MYISETNSTNTLLKEHYSDEANLFTIRTDYQSAGRGQVGNRWESERGQNLLFSTLLRDTGIRVERQFVISQMVSLALVRAVGKMLRDSAPLRIKWPNDIYYRNCKLAGVLIENTLCQGEVSRSIVGVGLNVNQTVFVSDAPNPISMRQIDGTVFDSSSVLDAFLHEIAAAMKQDHRQLAKEYRNLLYRKDGYFLWEDADGRMEARISDITEQGCLVLQKRNGETKQYHFKQIKYIL